MIWCCFQSDSEAGAVTACMRSGRKNWRACTIRKFPCQKEDMNGEADVLYISLRVQSLQLLTADTIDIL